MNTIVVIPFMLWKGVDFMRTCIIDFLVIWSGISMVASALGTAYLLESIILVAFSDRARRKCCETHVLIQICETMRAYLLH